MFADIQKELLEIAEVHSRPKKSRNHLQCRHLKEFDQSGDDLFYKFARVVCRADCINRKELLETWAMALHVHDYFWKRQKVDDNLCNRFADLASGHGLLSWALLILGDEHTTAVCIDHQMPLAVEKLRDAFLKEWPQLEGRWDFVEGKIEYLEPSPCTVLVGVHCCATLSDEIVHLAIQGNSPLALVPCCHTSKNLSLESKQEIRQSQTWTLADFIDSHRIQRLRKAGFKVEEGTIPKVFTPKNRIILATPSPEVNDNIQVQQSVVDNNTICRVPKTLANLKIPVADTLESRTSIRSIGGREAADLRRGHSRTLLLQVYQPSGYTYEDCLKPEEIAVEANTSLSRTDIVAWADFVRQDVLSWPLKQNGFPINQDHSVKDDDQRPCRTYRMVYRCKGAHILSKGEALEIHTELCGRIPEAFPGAEIRPIGR